MEFICKTYKIFVCRRIVQYDEWSSITIHVALDNAVIEEEIREFPVHLRFCFVLLAKQHCLFSDVEGDRKILYEKKKKMQKTWWKEDFADIYLKTS